MRAQRPPRLSVVVDDPVPAAASSPADFKAGEVVISAQGLVQVRHNHVLLTSAFNPKELVMRQEDVIGRGACSVVRKAVYQGHTLVAVKQINIQTSAAHHAQLVEEIKTLYKTDCACIVKFYGAYLAEDNSNVVNIVLEYLDGGSLANVLDQVGPVPERVIANMTFQVLWGLGYIKHERRVHRDIKPQNILINSQGQVKLTDFGVSKELMNTMAMGKTYVGTFKYMAPERLRNEPHNFASDVYSLGIVLYELAMGKSPFAEVGENHIGVLQTVVWEEIRQLPNNEFSPEFCDVVAKCIAKDPKARPTPEQLLSHPWFAANHASSLGQATDNVREWIESLQ